MYMHHQYQQHKERGSLVHIYKDGEYYRFQLDLGHLWELGQWPLP